ncbi:MAG: RHS repeat-associated core domain-containing protein [Solirubrobacteraceae bacterium]
MEIGVRSCVPQLGRFLQKDPVPGGSANPYGYTDGDPVNETDLTGEYVKNNYVLSIGVEQNAVAIALEVAREAAMRREAEEKALAVAINAQMEAKWPPKSHKAKQTNSGEKRQRPTLQVR